MSPPKGEVVDVLPGLAPRQRRSNASMTLKTALIVLAALSITTFGRVVQKHFWHCTSADSHDLGSSDICPQASELIPEKNNVLWETLSKTYGTESFRMRAIDWLSGAVRVPTESYDDMDSPGVDPRWEKFGLLHDYLFKSFPLVHSSLELTKVNSYGLIYVWKGSDNNLKPLLLAGHQDVVPVEPSTYDEWSHPPFSGHYDGEKVWGRGSVDDKSGLIGIFSTLEILLENGYQPTRTVVLASGFDEECSGRYGAGSLALKLLEMFGENGFAVLLDEGAGFGDEYGRIVATPGVAEKGSLNVMVEVATSGGHASIPPPHTSIGILAELLVTLEKNPFDVQLARGSPTYKHFQCLARHAPNLSAPLKKHLMNADHSEKARREAEKLLFEDWTYKNLAGTTQAIDVVHGGVKVNALPERAYAVVNHRISTESSIAVTQTRDANLLKSAARELNLSYTAFDVDMNENTDGPTSGTLRLSAAYEHGLEPAPISPTEEDSAPYQLLSGSIKAAYNSHRGLSGDDNIIVSPGIMSGNTDTRYYWRLTQHIFRYGHTDGSAGGILLPGIHTVNEALSASNFVEMIRFFTTFILNVDESPLP